MYDKKDLKLYFPIASANKPIFAINSYLTRHEN